MARLDAIYRPVAESLVDPGSREDLGARVRAELAELAVEEQAEAVLRGAIVLYVAGDEDVRARLRALFRRYTSFQWAAHLPREWDTAEEFRAWVIHASMRDQGFDTRDELLGLKDLCDRADAAGIDRNPILEEVAAMSSEEDHYGMGSMRELLLMFVAGPAKPRKARRRPGRGG